MADRFIIHGAAFNGDGTSSAEATSDGGVGAWNTITILEGAAPAYGSLPAGSTVHIRSKTSGGADITRTLAANVTLGSASAVAGGCISFVLDNGSVWAGVSGTLTYSCPSSYAVTIRAFNHLKARSQNALVFYEADSTVGSGKYTVTLQNGSGVDNALFDFSFPTGYGAGIKLDGTGHVSTLRNPVVKSRTRNGTQALFFNAGSATVIQIINPNIELLQSGHAYPVFLASSISAGFEIVGGRVFGAGAGSGVPLLKFNPQFAGTIAFSAVGFSFPSAMRLFDARPSYPCRLDIFGADGGMGAATGDRWGTADSRTDGLYPTLNAFLPNNANTPWSWRVYPQWAGVEAPVRLNVAKMFLDTAAAKTIAVEVLIATAFVASATKSTMWIDVIYIDDASGLPMTTSSYAPASDALDASDANWTSTSYGPTALTKKRMAVTTPTAIKQDSMIVVAVRSTFSAATDQQIYFVCPDVGLE